MKLCRVTLCIDNVRAQTTLYADSSIDALLAVLRIVPEHAVVKAVVAVLKQ